MIDLDDVLQEAKTRALRVNTDPLNLTGKVIIAYDEDDLLDNLKGVRSYPAVGVVYEGMRSVDPKTATENKGVSEEIAVALVLVQMGDAIHRTDEKRTKAIDFLTALRKKFLGQRSPVTGHKWHFLVESPVELKSGMVCWVQRWALPIQMKPEPPFSL